MTKQQEIFRRIIFLIERIYHHADKHWIEIEIEELKELLDGEIYK